MESSVSGDDVMLLARQYHDGGDDGNEGVAVGQQAVRRRGAAQGPSYGRRDALREQRGGRGGGGRCRCSAPRLLLLHLLFDMVLYDVAVFHAAGGGGAGNREAARGAVGGAAAAEGAAGEAPRWAEAGRCSYPGPRYLFVFANSQKSSG